MSTTLVPRLAFSADMFLAYGAAAPAQKNYGPGGTDTEIKLGHAI